MKLKKITKIIIILTLVVITVTSIFSVFVLIDASTAKLDEKKLSKNSSDLIFFDKEDNQIDDVNLFNIVTSKDKLPQHVYNSFIAIEDRRFYDHSGIDIKRIFGAAWSNLKSASFKEGASTITQQLVKNTQLSPEKTIYRKAKEIKLAKDIEKKYSKQQILDMYLNVIYFGSGCYGIENAANFYFNKTAAQLDINESASLAAIIKAPSIYSPYANYEKFKNRKDIVLDKMLECNLISKSEFETNHAKDIELCKSEYYASSYNDYLKACINEVCEILKIDIKDIKNYNYKIYTYMDKQLQNDVDSKLKSNSYYENYDKTDSTAIVLDNNSFSVSALSVKSKLAINQILRQPGSAIKPALVYAPALEYNIIAPSTQILDEQTNFEGYAPSNYKDKYYGYIDARQALSFSLNIPAVKILNSTGIEKSKIFAERLGIKFDKQDNNLGLSLGGLTKGCTPLDLAASYIPFANGGYYCKPRFVKKIVTENDKVIYDNSEQSRQVMRDDTAYLTSNMLMDCAKNGTAKKLSDFAFDLAAKTGTVGFSGYNTDAYSIAYTTENTFCIWMGSLYQDKLALSVTGGSYPTILAREIIRETYKNHVPKPFEMPDSVIKKEIDTEYLKLNHIIKLASDITPERYVKTEYFSKHNLPAETSDLFNMPKVEGVEIKYEQNKVTIKFLAKEFINYTVERVDDKNQTKNINTIEKKNGIVSFVDNNISDGKTYQYIITPSFKNSKQDRIVTGEVFLSNKILIPFRFQPDKNTDDKNWWEDSDFMDFE